MPVESVPHFASQRDADAHILQEQITELEGMKRLNRVRKERLALLYVQLEALRAPVHLLPDDILKEIFERASDDGRDEHAGLAFSHVGVRWRRVALQTPRLWRKFTLIRPLSNIRTRRLDGLDEKIRRSGSCPLILTVSSKRKANDTLQSIIGSATHLISRTEVLEVRALHRGSWSGLRALPVTTILSELSFASEGVPDVQHWFGVVLDTLSLCPNLQVLRLHGPYHLQEKAVPDRFRAENIPLHNLRVFESQGSARLIAFRVLQHTNAKPEEFILRCRSYEAVGAYVSTFRAAMDNLKNVTALSLSGSIPDDDIRILLECAPQAKHLVFEHQLMLSALNWPTFPYEQITVKHVYQVRDIWAFVAGMDPAHARRLVLRFDGCGLHMTQALQDRLRDQIRELVCINPRPTPECS